MLHGLFFHVPVILPTLFSPVNHIISYYYITLTLKSIICSDELSDYFIEKLTGVCGDL